MSFRDVIESDYFSLGYDYFSSDDYIAAEQDAADEWCEGFDRLCEIGVLDSSTDNYRNVTLNEIRRLMSYIKD